VSIATASFKANNLGIDVKQRMKDSLGSVGSKDSMARAMRIARDNIKWKNSQALELAKKTTLQIK
jgi:hypothetical protein